MARGSSENGALRRSLLRTRRRRGVRRIGGGLANPLSQRDDTRLHTRDGVLHIVTGLPLRVGLFLDGRQFVRQILEGIPAFAI